MVRATGSRLAAVAKRAADVALRAGKGGDAAPDQTAAPAAEAPAAKAPAKQTAKQSAKKATATKAAAKKSAATSTAKKAATSAEPAKKAAKKAPAKAAAAKTAVAAKAPAKKTTAKKPTAKKTAAKKAAPQASASQSATARSTASANVSGPMVKADEDPWTPEELADLRAELLADRVRLADELSLVEHELADLMRDAGDGAGNDQADVGSTTFERDHEMSIAKNARDMLEQTLHALERLDQGSYGQCESCGEAVGKMRLMAFPRATLCLTCKQREERR